MSRLTPDIGSGARLLERPSPPRSWGSGQRFLDARLLARDRPEGRCTSLLHVAGVTKPLGPLGLGDVMLVIARIHSFSLLDPDGPQVSSSDL